MTIAPVGTGAAPAVVGVSRQNAGAEYVATLAQAQMASYRAQPADVIGAYSHELGVADVYRGRQVLELLQNADDAGMNTPGVRRILFRLTDSHLIVANTGEPFSERGIRSLVVSNASPKRLSRNRFIGSKGLGFRSVLTWSPSPLVLSGEFLVAFSPEHARQQVSELANELPELRQDVDAWVEKLGNIPAPTMRFPYVPGEDDDRLRLALGVRNEGFDTVIVLPLITDARGTAIREEIQDQLGDISGETVIFCRHLTEVRVEAEDQRTWVVERGKTERCQRVVIESESGKAAWTVHRRDEALPTHLIDEELQDTPEFEIAVAVPDNAVDSSSHRLCVYFATDDVLPTQLLAHATLATDPSRKHVTRHPANRHILGRLADLLASVAESEEEGQVCGRGLELLAGAVDCDKELKDLGFLSELVSACRRHRLFPKLAGGVGTAPEVLTLPNSAWLKIANPEIFPETLDPGIPARAAKFAAQMGLETYEQAVLGNRLEQLVRGQSTPSEAGRIIGLLVSAGAVPRHPVPPSVLIGEGGTPIPSVHTVFLPADQTEVRLPAWVERFAFMHPEFAEAVRATLGVATLRDIRSRLVDAGYRVEEFRLEGVARHLLGEADRHKENASKDKAVALCRDLLSCLYTMASAGDSTDLRSVALEVVTTRGNPRRASTCYLGPDYPRGALVHAMYGPLGTDEFAAGPPGLGITGDAESVQLFLTRLGVRPAPRVVSFTDPYTSPAKRSFLTTVLDGLPYPNRIFGQEIANRGQAERLLRCSFTGLTLPDRWEQVLLKGDPHAVVAYLLGDGRRYQDSGPVSGATFQARQGREQKHWPYSAVSVPNPAHHLLRTLAWVPCEDKERRTPDRIILSRTGRRVLAGAYVGHGLDLKHPLLQGIGGAAAVDGLLHVLGAVHSLDTLKAEELYKLLLELPARDPDGVDAGRIYRALVENADLDTSSPLRERFVQQGQMWGTRNGLSGYYPVAELRYAARSSLPAAIRRRIPLVAIDARRGSRSIERVFGIKPLGQEDISIALDEILTRERPWSAEAARLMRRAIPYLYAYRLSRTVDDAGRERNVFSNTRLRICERVAINISVLGQEQPVLLDDEMDGLVVRAADLLLLVGPSSYPGTDPVFWRAVGDLIADAVEVAGAASEFAQLLGCSTDEQRLRLLDLMTDGDAKELLADAEQRLNLVEEPEPEHDPTPVPVPPPVAPASPTAPPQSAAANPGAQAGLGTSREGGAAAAPPAAANSQPSGAVTEHQSAPAAPQPVEARQPVFVPTEAPERRTSSLRRFVVTRSVTKYTWSATLARLDEAASLQLVMDFERQQGRFPLRVEHIRGSDSLGCDIISFDSESELREVEQTREVQPSRICRLIEVKGRSDRTTAVGLEPNQRTAAERHRDRFFLYRVYKGPVSGEVQLAILPNPAGSAAESVVTQYSYDLRAGSGAEWFGLVETPSE